MPTSYDDQAYPVDIFAVSAGDVMTVVSITLVDTDDDGLIEVGETVNGFTISNVYVGDTVTVDGTMITGVTFTTSGGAFFTPNDGSVLIGGTVDATSTVAGSTSMPVASLGPPCFMAGTEILTQAGFRPVETLQAGDLVVTRDNGLKPLVWVGHSHMPGTGRFAPVRIEKTILGNDAPLFVSQQHRVMLAAPVLEMAFAAPEVLVAAKHLTRNAGFELMPMERVHYVHIMFDQHEMVNSNGAWSESYFYNGAGKTDLPTQAADELIAIFGNTSAFQSKFGETALPCLTAHEAAVAGALVLH